MFRFTFILSALAVTSALILFPSCSPRVFPPAERADSVRIEIRERVVYDTALVAIEREVEKVIVRDTISHLENTYAASDARIDSSGFLHHSLETKNKLIRVPVAVAVHDTVVVEKESVKEYVKVNELTGVQQAWIRVGKVLTLVLAAAFVLMLVVFYLRCRFR